MYLLNYNINVNEKREAISFLDFYNYYLFLSLFFL